MNIFSKKTYGAIVITTCVLAFAIGVYKMLQNNRYVTAPSLPTPARPKTQPPAPIDNSYEKIDVQKEPLLLRGDEKRIIQNLHYLAQESITLKDNATLIIKNSTFEHANTFGKNITLNAYGKSKVILENSIIHTSCDKIVSWNFHDHASLVAHAVQATVAGCFPRQTFLHATRADITSWDNANVVVCDSTNLTIRDSKKLRIDLCLPTNARVDEALPKQTTASYIFPNKKEFGIPFALSLLNVSIGTWNVRVVPGSDVVIQDTDNVTFSIHAQKPWEQKTVSFDSLQARLFEDQTWKIIDAKLHLLNTSVGAWDFFLEHTNKLELRGSTAHTIYASEDAGALVEDSTIERIETKDFSEATFQNSRLNDRVHSFDKSKITFIDSIIGTSDERGRLSATDKSVITLTHTVSNATMIEEADGKIVVQ